MPNKSKKRNKNDNNKGSGSGAAAAAAKKEKKKVGFNLPDDHEDAGAASPSSKKKKAVITSTSNRNVDDADVVRNLTGKLSAVPRIRPPGAPPAIPHGAGLSRGQLAVVIVLALSVARLMQVGSAATEVVADVTKEDASSTTAAFRPSQTCIDHLGTEACQQPSIRALLKYKYLQGLQSLVYVVSATVQAWRSELLLQTLCGFLCVLLGLFASTLLVSMFVSTGLHDGVYGNAAMCLVLTVVAFPHEHIPRQRTSSYRTLQSFCLLSLVVPHLYEFVPLFRHNFFEQGAESGPSLMVRSTEPEFWAAHKPAVQAIVNFVLFDRVTMILMLAFAWYYLPNLQQRTFLLSMAILNVGEYVLQRTETAQSLAEHVQWSTIENRHHALLLSAGWCLLAWIAPPLRWKKKLS